MAKTRYLREMLRGAPSAVDVEATARRIAREHGVTVDAAREAIIDAAEFDYRVTHYSDEERTYDNADA